MSKDFQKICLEARKIVEKVGHYLAEEFTKAGKIEIEEKEKNQLVSYVDRTAEQQLVRELNSLLPEATFLTEEGTVEQSSGEWQWIIDPLDGTTNFLYQIHWFSISVGLKWKEEIVVGLVYVVCQKECFYAWKGGGAYLNGTPIQAKTQTNFSSALITTGFAGTKPNTLNTSLKIIEGFARQSQGIRRFGSAAIDLAYVACGRLDAYFEFGLNAWDAAGGILLVQEADGTVTDFKGGNNFLFGGQILAANRALHPDFLQIIEQNL